MAQPATQLIDLRVDRESDLSPGLQLAWRIRALIAARRLGPGDRLPSVRELADLAGVNANTARAIYGRLEAEGLLVSRHGLGTFVAEGAPTSPDLERLAADAVELAENVVEEQKRWNVALREHQVAFGHDQREYRASLLTLRTVSAQVAVAARHAHVAQVGPAARRPALDVRVEPRV
jgi:DNA-binding transcriptional regulator YhcF (GntR family)